MDHGLGLIAGVALLLALLLMSVPAPVPDYHPVAWTPPSADVSPGVRVPGAARSISGVEVHGPGDIAVDRAGRLYTGDRDDRILRVFLDGRVEHFAEVGGRPPGLAFDRGGRLLVANHGVGLQAVLPDGRAQLLVSEVAARAVQFANDVVVGADRLNWFTDSSRRHHRGTLGDPPSYLVPDLLEGRPTGRLLVYDPATGRTAQALDGLYFPNGVALTPGGDTLWIAESTRYRIRGCDLTSGAARVVADALPGVPDGITAADGVMLIAVYARTQALDHPVLPTALGREVIGRLPTSLFVDQDDPLGGGVLELRPDGALQRWHTGITPAPTNVLPHDGRWLLGALLGQPIRAMTI